MALRRRYKIQDVIQRRQVLLVQVVKEERGNKGAALTTYLSLAGRYCVLMPNSSHGGGISRKISSVADRRRLKSIIAEMQLPKSMGCIVRTAGLQRTKTEIKRDFDYLARLWDGIRENTLNSSAPALIHSDSDLIKRAIRDIYNRDIEDIVVEGETGYRDAREFMKLLMPSHAKRVKAYVDPVPLFQRYGAEDQLTAMYDPVVQLKSGGYIVINPTEALVSIDINSGRSTKEHGIEATAVNTNLEAAREIARQLRLRDMAGLVVIDFIDMEYGSNVRKVEKAMKDALRNDRARIQVGRISGFGLMEMSRQRLRTGVLEATTRGCPHCDGTGLVRTAGSAGLSALRLIEEEAAKGRGIVITLFASQEAAIYLLNTKRHDLAEIEMRYGVSVEVIPEGENEGAKMRVMSSGPRNEFVPKFEAIALIEEDDDYPEDDYSEDEAAEEERGPRRERASEGGESAEGGRKRRKRRRGRGRDRGDEQGEGGSEGANDNSSGDNSTDEASFDDSDDSQAASGEVAEDAEGSESEAQRKRRRRSRSRRRGGRGRDGEMAEGAEAGAEGAQAEGAQAVGEAYVETYAEAEAGIAQADEAAPASKPRRSRKKVVAEDVAALETAPVDVPMVETPEAPTPAKRGRKKAEVTEVVAAVAEEPAIAVAAESTESAPVKPKRSRSKKADAAAEDSSASESTPSAQAEGDDDNTPRRGGWWQRTFGT
jgi:ribonuclease E